MLEAALAAVGARAEDCAMIGDTAYDMAMATAAGARALGVAWGYHPPAELLATGAEAVAANPAELGHLLGLTTMSEPIPPPRALRSSRLVRLAGVVLVLLGLAIQSGRRRGAAAASRRWSAMP